MPPKNQITHKQWTQEECDEMNKKYPVTCGSVCACVAPYGWTIEADCHEHDKPIKRCDCGGTIETHQGNNGFPDDWYCIGTKDKDACGKEWTENPFLESETQDSEALRQLENR